MLKLLLCLTAVVSLCAGAAFKHQAVSFQDLGDSIQDSYNGRIVGGKTADIVMHPHQISFRFKKITCANCIRGHYCGGSIISATMIVTAAHCVAGVVPSQIHIVAGSSQRQGSDGAIAPVKTIVMHESFNSRNFSNDIALLILSTALPLNNFTIKAIELDQDVAPEGAVATVSGWGKLGNGKSADYLQEVRVPIISNVACNEDYNPRFNISDDMICAGLRGVGGKDACQGDSGGPLVLNGKLIGVVSWGVGCALPSYPGVYARISYQLPWLLEKIARHQ